MVLKKGKKDNNIEAVKAIQEVLGIKQDGDFGPTTEKHVKNYQSNHGLKADGEVGGITAGKMGIDLEEFLETDLSSNIQSTESGLIINKKYLDKDEYVKGPTEKYYLFLHHTAGWNNPYSTIRNWNNDTRGRIATQFVVGGTSIKNGDDQYDGEIVECFPDNGYAYHLGKNGSRLLHPHSVGIEVCNFGQLTLKNGKYYNYVKREVPVDQVCDLGYKFRGYQYWHAYTDKQIEAVRQLILEIKDRHPQIDITKGLKEWLEVEEAQDAFDFKDDAFYGKVKGMLSHTNTRKDKADWSPQPKIVEMLKSL